MSGGRITRRGLAHSGLALSGMALTASTATAANRPQPRQRPLAPEDRDAIEDLFSRYVWAYDCSDEAEFASLFTADAVVVGKGTVYRGAEAIIGWLRYLTAMRDREGDDVWMHEAGQFRFVPTAPGTCLVYAYATHFSANSAKAQRGVRSLGSFTAECVRHAGEWRFRRFSISPWDHSKVPWAKPLPWADTAGA